MIHLSLGQYLHKPPNGGAAYITEEVSYQSTWNQFLKWKHYLTVVFSC